MAFKFRKIITYLTYRHGRNIDNPRLIDKSQVFTVKLSLINKLIEDTKPKFVLITRNPYDTCYRAASGKAIDMKNYSKFLRWGERLKICAQHWTNSMNCMFEDIEKDKINVLIVSFEDFLIQSKEITKKICGFAGLDFEKEMLPQEHHKMHLGVRFEKRWYPLNPGVNEPYLKKLTKDDMKIIESICGKNAIRLGYQRPEI